MQSVNVTQVTILTKYPTLESLNAEIKERMAYYREQEKAINDLIELGNMRLLELNYDIKLAKQTLRDYKTDIRTAAQDKALLKEDLETMRKGAKDLYGNTGMVIAYP